MALPEGVTTATVTAGVPVSHTGAPVKAFLSIEPSVFLVHTATGTPLVDFLEELSINEGVAGQFILPHTDQAGFQDENGNAYTNWYYTARITYSTTSKAKTKAPKIKVFQLATGQTLVDLDSLPGGAPALPYTAPIATVTSVNGRTGPVTIVDEDMPERLSETSLTAAVSAAVAPKLDKTEAATTYNPLTVLPESAERAYTNIRTNTAIVALRFDDSLAQSATVGDLLFARGLVGGFALIPDQFDAAGSLTTAQAKALQDQGHEIMAHNGETMATPENFYSLTVGAANDLEADGMYVQTFVQPGAWDSGPYKFDSLAKYDTPAGRLIKSRFLCSLAYVLDYAGGGSTFQVRTIPSQNRHGVSHWTGDNVPLLANWQAPVNRAIAVGGAIEMLIHPVALDGSGKPSTATFTAFLDWLVTQQNAGNITVLTPTAAIMAQKGTAQEIVPDPDFTKYAADATIGTWSVGAGVTFADAEAGATGKQALTTSTNPASISVYFAESLRSIRVTGKAKSVDATGNATIRLIARDGAGAIIKNISRNIPVTNTGWTNCVTNFGIIPGATNITLTWFCPSSTPAGVKWANASVKRT